MMLLGTRHEIGMSVVTFYLLYSRNLLCGHGTQEPLFCMYAPPPKPLQQSLAENV